MAYERKVALLSIALTLPALCVALLLIWQQPWESAARIVSMVALVVLSAWIWFRLRRAVVHPLLTLVNLLDSLRPNRSKRVFLVSQRDKIIPVPVEDIAYFYIEHELCFLYTFDERRFVVNHTLDELEKLLDPQAFYRANRQFLVHIKSVTEVEQYFARKLLLKLNTRTREPVVVSKAKASDFLHWMESR